MNINIDNIVADCLGGENRRVVIPGFGALIRRPDGGIAFVDILNSDDGVLAEALGRGAGLTYDEAREAVGKYSFHLKTELLHNKKVVIEGVGTIRMAPDGCYDLYPPDTENETDAPADENFKMETPVSAAVSGMEAADDAFSSEEPVFVTIILEEEAGPEVFVADQTGVAAKDFEIESALTFHAETGPSAPDTLVSENSVPVFESVEEGVQKDVETAEETHTAAPESAPAAVNEPGTHFEAVAGDGEVAVGVPLSGGVEAAPYDDPVLQARRSERDMIRRLLYDDEPLPVAATDGEPSARMEKKAESGSKGNENGSRENVPLTASQMIDAENSPQTGQDKGEVSAPVSSAPPQVRIRRPKKKRVDWVLIAGIIVVVLAVCVLVYGEVVKKGVEVDLPELVIPEQ